MATFGRLSGKYFNICLLVKFIYSEKVTKFWKIFTLQLTVCTVVKSKVKISQNFVAFSEYMNFNTWTGLSNFEGRISSYYVSYLCNVCQIIRTAKCTLWSEFSNLVQKIMESSFNLLYTLYYVPHFRQNLEISAIVCILKSDTQIVILKNCW